MVVLVELEEAEVLVIRLQPGQAEKNQFYGVLMVMWELAPQVEMVGRGQVVVVAVVCSPQVMVVKEVVES
jgi:hypothetical protein